MLQATSERHVLCKWIVELHRQRQDLHRAEKSLTLQIKANCRRLCAGDKADADVLYAAMFGKGEHYLAAMAYAIVGPFVEARSIVSDRRKAVEKRMAEHAQGLPAAEWVSDVRGMAIGSLAAIVGEAGDLSNYPTVAKLWKRLGLAVIQGERQQRKTGDLAIEHAYNPSRRSVVWNVGEALVKANGYYAGVYRERKEYERHKAEQQGLEVLPAAKITKAKQAMSQGHVHNRAKRYMEKQLVRDLWRAWRDCG